jgi:hypothetical protein
LEAQGRSQNIDKRDRSQSQKGKIELNCVFEAAVQDGPVFDTYRIVLPLAISVALIVGVPFLGYLFRGRRFGSDRKDSFFRYKLVKLHWVTVALLLTGFVFQYPVLWILAIVSVPYLYRLSKNKERAGARRAD